MEINGRLKEYGHVKTKEGAIFYSAVLLFVPENKIKRLDKR